MSCPICGSEIEAPPDSCEHLKILVEIRDAITRVADNLRGINLGIDELSKKEGEGK